MMTTKTKAIAAALAILIAGAALGWNVSRMTGGPEAPSDSLMTTDLDQSSGDLSPTQPYLPQAPRVETREPVRRVTRSYAGITLPAGSLVEVTVHQALSSKTAQVGERWTGSVAAPVYQSGRVVIPAGSLVRGTVSVARPATRGERATLRLALSSISVNGRSYRVRGSSEAVVAGSPRARNVGAVAGGTAAGALIGRAVSGSTKGTVIGGIVGGTAAGAAVAASKGYQVSIPAGKELSFTTRSSVTVRRG